MQPEPSNVSQNLSKQIASDSNTPPSHHGLHDHLLAASPHAHLEERRESSPNAGASQPDSPSNRIAEDDVEAAPRLSTTTSTSPNCAPEYENSLAQSLQPKDGMTYIEPSKSQRKYSSNKCPISMLPNEVLIHAISHLSPNDLAAVSLVSRHFHGLVTTPHAWRVAFSRYFPGSEVLSSTLERQAKEYDTVRSEKRSFTRLTALASWRSEYILRTKLLRSLARGKPARTPSTATSARTGQTQIPTPAVMYNAQTFTTINHLHATFGTGLNIRIPRLVHGADDVGMATSSDPVSGKVDSWGQSDPNFYAQFSERFPGVAEWGLGSGEIVGRPNVMDVSQPNGMIYGQGCSEGSCYYRAVDELRGRFIAEPTDLSMPDVGIPKLGVDGGAVCAVWIAKSSTIPLLSEGLIGMMMGSAAGVVTACSIGTDGLRGSRLQRGELTARWVLSPGVPIIAVAVDDNYSLKRQAQNRIWAVALNALGELFYLTKFPARSQAPKINPEEHFEYLAWLTGRSVYWNEVEPSRRTARPDPYNDREVNGSYSPRSSWDGMCLSKGQVSAETKEIQQFIRKRPIDFQKSCIGWDMRRRLEVDFAGDDGNYAGEAIMVFECGLEEDDVASIHRFTRWKVREQQKNINVPETGQANMPSLFGGSESSTGEFSYAKSTQRARSSSYMSSASSPERANLMEEWRCSRLIFGGLRPGGLLATTLDISTFAILTMSEDPALGFSAASTASSPYASPMSVASQPSAPSDVPGQRARFVAVGTNTGTVILWNMRAPVSRSSDFTNDIEPARVIYTESPEISCLALTGLHLVIGGNDGLVQAWDPLASSMQPIRTLNSRFASRARRRIGQAQASAQGVGVNLFAAGAICLDPDPTTLRGAVSLGTQIKYWSYSSTAADQYKSSKRRLRRSERGSNNGGERITGVGRVNLKDYIANERYEIEREQVERRRQADRMAGRFGIDLLGNEEEALAYAAMLSQETLEVEQKKRRESESSSVLSSHTVTPEPSIAGPASFSSPTLHEENEIDADIAEAIRLSLQETETPPSSSYSAVTSPATPDLAFGVPVKYAKSKKVSPKSRVSPTRLGKGALESAAGMGSSSGLDAEMSDLEYALQLSLAEEASRMELEAGVEDEFPPLKSEVKGKGKGRMK